MKVAPAAGLFLLAGAGLLPAQPALDRAPLPNNQGAAGLILLSSERPFTAAASEQAQAIVAAFARDYERLGRPRLLIQVRREPAAPAAGRSAEGSAAPAGGGPEASPARGVERRFNRIFRHAGAMLVEPPGEEAAPGTAQAGVADVVVEVIVSRRRVTVPEPTGERTLVVPEISATAVRLGDSAVLGRATARDVLGSDLELARRTGPVEINDLAEAVALALMEDVVRRAK